MLYNPDQDALTELKERDPAEKNTDAAPISIDPALETLNSLLKGKKKRPPSTPPRSPSLTNPAKLLFTSSERVRAGAASKEVSNMGRPGRRIAPARRLRFFSPLPLLEIPDFPSGNSRRDES